MTPLEATRYIWLAWVISWFAAAGWTGRTVKRPSIGRELWYRVLTAGGSVLLFGFATVRRHDAVLWTLNGSAGWILVAFTALSALFMWWARLTLGRFWSSSVTHKAGHHVIDRGPYAIVRHPIYTGLIVGILSTVSLYASAQTVTGAILIVIGIYIKARLEEEFLRVELGADAYDAYARRVPMLIPTGKRA